MRICMYGGPGIGKSSAAAWLFSELKRRHVNVELVTEYIKSWAWEKRAPTSYDQVYIFGKQIHKEDLLVRRNVHIITDSPLPMQLVYVKRQGCTFHNELLSICKKFEIDHPALHILLQRTTPFQTAGRYETLEEAKSVDEAMKLMLQEYGQPWYPYDMSDNFEREQLLDHVLLKLDTAKSNDH